MTATGLPIADPAEPRPPATGVPTIDETLGRLAELSALPVAEHHDRLAQAHAVLDQTLDRDGTDGP